MISSDFFNIIQKKSLPGVWSKGVALSRENSVIQDSAIQNEGETEEIILRVLGADHPVSRKVSLWPEDEDWHCDCESRTEVCIHVVAAVLTLRKQSKPGAGAQSPAGAANVPSYEAGHEAGQEQASQNQTSPKSLARIEYRLLRRNGFLVFERWILQGGTSPGKTPQESRLTDSLVSFVGGVNAGRISSLPLAATQEDFRVDAILGAKKTGELSPETWVRLFKILVHSLVRLDGKPVQLSAQPLRMVASLSKERGGFRLKQEIDPTLVEAFRNGVVLCEENILRAVEIPILTDQERGWLTGEGRFFDRAESVQFFTRILPVLEKKMQVKKPEGGIPEFKKIPPQIVLQLSSIEGGQTLSILPQIVYEGVNSDPNSMAGADLYIPDPEAEQLLARRLQNLLYLNPGQAVQLSGEAAVDFCLRLNQKSAEKFWEVRGEGAQEFGRLNNLVPDFKITSGNNNRTGFQVSFLADSSQLSNSSSPQVTSKQADPIRVFQAWKENANYVPLLGGGWARLPKDWLDRYGPRVMALLGAKEQAQDRTPESGESGVGELPGFWMPDLAQLCDELGQPCPPSIQKIRQLLNQFDQPGENHLPSGTIEKIELPEDLKATLRHYQTVGVSWLKFLGKVGMGALLADDMGLGKTLQALCAIQGKTLVVTPTSVLHSWEDQIRQFRPGLKIQVYHGHSRGEQGGVQKTADVVLTSYGILRLDLEILSSLRWGTIILDEAQIIKNPSSQVAQAAHSLQADFKIVLTGTPVENRLDDLWSQFQFLNPGLLGTQETFQQIYAGPIGRGNPEAARELRKRLKPFILRRLKKEVAPELPPKIEKTLVCELGVQERDLYESLLASTRKEVLEKLDAGGNIMEALELLLRLRQACCHPYLVPGQDQSLCLDSTESSKVSLLMATLENSLELGHKALIFSQWTSFLDLIEPSLQKRRIRYSRLDGSTSNRREVVHNFQEGESETDTQVMLISLKAGGVGLTLTAADHVYLMDPWWNPTVENQAIDRAHRIGQVNSVVVHRLIVENSIEERILDLQKAKAALAAIALEDLEVQQNPEGLDDRAWSLQAFPFSRKDIMALLGE